MDSIQANTPDKNTENLETRQPLDIWLFINMLLKEIWLMLVVFLVIVIIGFAYAMTLQKKYTAEARLSVLIGEEYAAMSDSDNNGPVSSPTQEDVVQSEIEVITSTPVASRTIQAIGLNKLFTPEELVTKNGEHDEQSRLNAGVDKLRKQFAASSTPNTTVIRLAMTNKNPELAAASLNKMIDEYLSYRRIILFENRTQGYQEQAKEFGDQLAEVNKELNNMLVSNNISDYESETSNVQALLAATRHELYDVTSKLSEAQGRFSTLEKSYVNLPDQVVVAFENDIPRRRLDLQQKLTELREKYTEQSRPVRDMKKRIAELDSLIATKKGKGDGVIQMGPNELKEALEGDGARYKADVTAMRDKQTTLRAQVKQLEARAMQIGSLKTRYEDLNRRKAVLDALVRKFETNAANAGAKNQMSATLNDNVRIIERASVPVKGKSMKKIVVLGSVLFGGFTALIIGILHMLFTNPYFIKTNIGKALGLPVLAKVKH